MHFRGRFLRDTNEGHKLQPLRLSWNLTCHCQLHFWTHSMHFWGRFPRDTKPNPYDCPEIWRAMANYIFKRIPCIFVVGFWGTPMRDTNSNPSDCPEIWRAIVNYISEHIPCIFGVGTQNPIPPIALKFDVPWQITFPNAFHSFLC